MSVPPVSIVTVVRNAFFFTRLLIEKVREHSQGRQIEIIVVDRGSTDGTRSVHAAWIEAMLSPFCGADLHHAARNLHGFARQRDVCFASAAAAVGAYRLLSIGKGVSALAEASN